MVPRPLSALLLALLVGLVAAAPTDVSAGRRWCHRDPIYAINGKNVSIDVAVPWEVQKSVTGPIAVTLYVPHNVSVKGVYQDDGFNGYGEIANISRSSQLRVSNRFVPIRVQVVVPTKGGSVAVLVTITPDGGRTSTVNGKSNSSVGAAVNVPV